MSADSTVNVDAITNGNGGTAVLWSNDSTRAYGSITARGGALGGNGGLIETSGHWLDVTGIQINASATKGERGTWLLDPADVTIGAGTTNGAFSGGNPNVFAPASGASTSTIDVAALRTALETAGGTNVTITTTNNGVSGSGLGDITIASALTWTPTNSATLRLLADRDVNINAPINATNGNLVVCCGRDINVREAITIVGGSILLSAGRDVRIERTIANPNTKVTVTDGNIEMCAARDVILSNTFNPGLAPLMTLTNGTTIAGLSLASDGVPLGLSLFAGTGATGPGVAGGTVNFMNGGLGGTYITTTTGGPGTPIRIVYNPISYAAPTDFSTFFTGTGGPVTSSMLVFPDGANKVFDGTTAATFTSLKADSFGNVPGGVTLAGTGTFNDATVGLGKLVTYSGLTLGGANAARFALPADCCGPTRGTGRTTGNITQFTQLTSGPLAGSIAGPLAGSIAGPLTEALAEESEEATAFSLPMIAPRTAGSPRMTALLESPPSMVLVESTPELPAETLVEKPPEVPPPPYVAPVRPRKQGRQ